MDKDRPESGKRGYLDSMKRRNGTHRDFKGENKWLDKFSRERILKRRIIEGKIQG